MTSKVKFEDQDFSLHCIKCKKWLKLMMLPYNEIIEGLRAEFDEVPFLVCNNCSTKFMPWRARLMTEYGIEQCKVKRSHGKFRSQLKTKREFEYCKIVKFDYDWIDYEFLPGLWRSWDEGALTPVFFDKKVLLKYSIDPDYTIDLFSDTYGTIFHKGEFLISFGINPSGKLFVWLYHLDRLPIQEQKYFSSYNLKSDHDIASEFYLSTIQAEFGTLSREQSLLELRLNVIKKLRDNSMVDLYHEIENLEELGLGIIKPIVWSEKGIYHTIITFNKICVESINTDSLKLQICKLDPGKNLSGLKGLKLLEKYLELKSTKNDSREIMKPFFVLYDLRQSLSHLMSTEKKNELLHSCYDRVGINNVGDFKALYEKLVELIINAYKQILRISEP